MKKLLTVVVAIMMIATVFAACKAEEPEATKAPAETSEAVATEAPAETSEAVEEATEEPEQSTYEIAMITDIGDIDDKSFNQGTWGRYQRICHSK